MSHAQISRASVSLVIVYLLFLGDIGSGQAEAQKNPLGTLKLAGKPITSLKLRRAEGGQIEEFRRPEGSIELPLGEYRVQEVQLEGGYTYYASVGPGRHQGPVVVGQQETLTVGAPLKQTIKIERQGRVLTMSYALLGAGGEQYTGGDRSSPPRFRIYRGDTEIASGEFEFG